MKKLLLISFVTCVGFYGCTSVAGIVAGQMLQGAAAEVATAAIGNALFSEDIQFSDIKFEKKESTNAQKGKILITGILVYKTPTIGSGSRFKDLSHKNILMFSLLDKNGDLIKYGGGPIVLINGSIESLEKDQVYQFFVEDEIAKNQWDVVGNIKLEKLDIK